MSGPREGPNPLRPYYIPPSIGFPSESSGTGSSGHRHGGNNGTSNYASTARDMFPDLDYSNYVPEGSQSTLDMIKEILDEAMYKYLAILLAQPFDVAKTILQVRTQATGDGTIPISVAENMRERPSQYRDSTYVEYPSDDSDPDEPAYFTNSAPSSTSFNDRGSRRRHITDRAGYVLPSSSSLPAAHQLVLKRSDSVLEVIGQLWTKEGAWGVWKASNSTFIYGALLKTFESWARSFLSAVFNAPEPGLISGLTADVIDTAYPWSSLGIAVGAAAIAGLLLAPIDIVRTKLILMSTTTPKRGLFHDTKLLPSFICPSTLVIPTFLHSIITPVFNHATPILLRTRFGIDPVLTPTIYSVTSFFSQGLELFVRLPVETVLRRGQMSVFTSPKYLQSGSELKTVVDVGPYRGTVGTMWMIIREEGSSSGQELVRGTGGAGAAAVRTSKKSPARKGQGVEGLFRGWRVGMWGLVGMWGAAAMGGIGGNGGEF